MDRAIPFPLVFQLSHDGQVRFAVSYKRPSEADTSKWVIEAGFATEPQPVEARRPPLPVALDLASLYEQIIRRHMPLPPRAGESLADHVARSLALEVKRKTQQQLEARLAREKQFNRRVEVNAALRSLTRELKTLTQP